MHPLLAGGVLVVLAALSFGASFVPLRDWALPVALLVASAKAAIVVLVFMGLGRASASAQLAALAALLMLLLLVGLMLADPLTREPAPVLGVGEEATMRARALLDSGHGNRSTRRPGEPRPDRAVR